MAAPDERVKLNHLMYARYHHKAISASRKFLLDFGFTIVQETKDKILYRGFGSDPVCVISEASPTGKATFEGGGWVVDSYEDLETAARIPGASSITDCAEPIGGKFVSLKDPAGGPIYVHWGERKRSAKEIEQPKALKFNTWDNKRRLGEIQRLPDGPSNVHKLGHYGYEVPFAKYNDTLNWYLTNFTLAPSDCLFSPETNKDVMAFIHIDRGEEYVDHHSFFISAGDVKEGYQPHHASFEVDDVDSELKGHLWLEKQGYELCWGVGRHTLGSQIFDYWFDPDDFVLEHYADGDLVNCRHKTERAPANPDTISVWGPNVPLAFLTRNPEDRGKVLPPLPVPTVA